MSKQDPEFQPPGPVADIPAAAAKMLLVHGLSQPPL